MLDIYTYTLDAMEQGGRVKIDIPSKSLTVNGEALISEGSALYPVGLERVEAVDALSKIEEAYIEYKYSLPASEHSSGKPSPRSRCLFKAMAPEEIPPQYLLRGIVRHEARRRLELIFLLYIVNGSISSKCHPFGDKWYWQSAKDKDLVILRQWLEVPNVKEINI